MRGFVLMFLVACGSSGSNPTAGGDKLTALAETRTMGELTNDEKKQLCLDFKAFQQKEKPSEVDTLRMMCQAKATMQTMSAPSTDEAATRAACKKELDACIAKKEKSQEPELDCNSPEFLGQMSACKELTIGEITECVRDMATVMKKLSTEDLCGGLPMTPGQPAVNQIFEKMKSPKCEVLETKCAGKTAAAPVDPAKFEQDTIAGLAALKTKMCACKDKVCGETIRAEMDTWGAKMAQQNPTFKPSAAGTQTITALVNDYTNCMVMAAAADSKPSPLTGSGSSK